MDDTFKWVIGISITVVLFIVGFAGRIVYQGRKEREKRIEQKLKIHFEDIKREVIDRISEMARSLAIRHNRLVTNYAPIADNYPFEKEETFKGFEIHFPKLASEWRQLNSDALILRDCVDIVARGPSNDNSPEFKAARKQINDKFFPLQQKFQDFARRLAAEVETTSKYQIGKTFTYDKKCPICKKF